MAAKNTLCSGQRQVLKMIQYILDGELMHYTASSDASKFIASMAILHDAIVDMLEEDDARRDDTSRQN